jgi:uncharacterized repeat protein (TIGR03803 family)
LPNGTLVGHANTGGAFGLGAIVRYDRNAVGTLTPTTLHSFSGLDGHLPAEDSGLVQGTDGRIYGTTCFGGVHDNGTVFSVSSAGEFSSLYSFEGPEGKCPNTTLVQAADGKLYGTTSMSLGPAGEQMPGVIFGITQLGEVSFFPLRPEAGVPGPLGPLFNLADGNLYATALIPEGLVLLRFELTGVLTIVGRISEDGSWDLVRGPIVGTDGAFYAVVRKLSPEWVTLLLRATRDGSFTTQPLFNDLPAVTALARTANGTVYVAIGHSDTAPHGEIYRVDPGATPVRVHAFSYWNGRYPSSLIATADGALAGTTVDGGPSRRGVVFRLTQSGSLSLQQSFSDPTPLGPVGSLIEGDGGALYGTSCLGGLFNAGTVFRVASDGTLAVLRSFAYWDGFCPLAPLIRGVDGALYGTTLDFSIFGGGLSSRSTAFRITPNGQFTPLHFFARGLLPAGGLFQASDGYFYGATYYGGDNGRGSVFVLSPAGAFAQLYSFGPELSGDGEFPYAPLRQGPDHALYGVTRWGGVHRSGAFFRIGSDGYSLVHSFSPQFDLVAPLVLFDGSFYGTARWRQSARGSVFRLSPAGDLTELHSFSGPDGSEPWGGLVVQPDGTLYGTTRAGGTHDLGTVFRISTDGTFSQVHAFSGVDGAKPQSALLRHSDGGLYGVTTGGGPGNRGVVFRVIPASP